MLHASRKQAHSCTYYYCTDHLVALLRTALLSSPLAARSLQNTLFQHTLLTHNFGTRYEERSLDFAPLSARYTIAAVSPHHHLGCTPPNSTADPARPARQPN